MRIGLIDLDGGAFPNLPLMKISAHHKQHGDHVEWYDPMFSGHMDKVYMSKVFSFSPDYEYFIDADEIITTLEQDLERIYTLKELGYWAYVMIYNKSNLKRGSIYRKLQRWCNNRFIFGTGITFDEYLKGGV